jgi:hypothetical protein
MKIQCIYPKFSKPIIDNRQSAGAELRLHGRGIRLHRQLRHQVPHGPWEVLAERAIPLAWLECALNEPALRQLDPNDASLERRYRPIPEYDGRVLRVVVNTSVEPVRVVSVFFDRSIRGKL